MVTINNNIVLFQSKNQTRKLFEVAECLDFTIDENNGDIYANIDTTYEQAMISFISMFFPGTMDPDTKRALRAAYDAIKEERMKSILALPWGERLRPYQSEAIVNMMGRKHNLLCFDMRLGKTQTAFSLAASLGHKKVMYVSPANIKYSNYKDLVENWGYDPTHFTLKDASKSRSFKAFFMNENYMFINYDIISKNMKDIEEFAPDHIIYDEVHHIKTDSTRKTRNVKALYDMLPNAHTVGLSGTPMANRVIDLYSFMHLTGHNLGKNKAAFSREFVLEEDGRAVGVQNVDMLRAKMSNFMIRRTKKNSGYHFPPEVISKIYFEVSDYREEYDDAMKKISQLSSDVDSITLNAHLMTLNRYNSYAKTPGAIEFLESIIEAGGKPVVATLFHDTLTALEKHFGTRSIRIDGSVSGQARDGLRKKFTSDDSVQIALCQMAAGSEGVDMSVSNDFVFLDFPWVPRLIQQMCARGSRQGKEESINIYFLIVPDTIDERIYSVVVDKADDINAVIDGNSKESVKYGDLPRQILQELIKK